MEFESINAIQDEWDGFLQKIESTSLLQHKSIPYDVVVQQASANFHFYPAKGKGVDCAGMNVSKLIAA